MYSIEQIDLMFYKNFCISKMTKTNKPANKNIIIADFILALKQTLSYLFLDIF